MRPCFVIADNETVKEFLNNRTADGTTYNGLKDFFFGYTKNLLSKITFSYNFLFCILLIFAFQYAKLSVVKFETDFYNTYILTLAS